MNIKSEIEKIDKKVFDAFGHSWACDKKIQDCMCQGGTFWVQVARPIISQALTALVEKAVEENIKVIRKHKESLEGKRGYTKWGTGYMEALDDILEKLTKTK